MKCDVTIVVQCVMNKAKVRLLERRMEIMKGGENRPLSNLMNADNVMLLASREGDLKRLMTCFASG